MCFPWNLCYIIIITARGKQEVPALNKDRKMSAAQEKYDQARAIEIELPKRVPDVEDATYWRKGSSFGKYRVYIHLEEDSTKMIWFDLKNLELDGIDDAEIEKACLSIISPWLEPKPAPRPKTQEEIESLL